MIIDNESCRVTLSVYDNSVSYAPRGAEVPDVQVPVALVDALIAGQSVLYLDFWVLIMNLVHTLAHVAGKSGLVPHWSEQAQLCADYPELVALLDRLNAEQPAAGDDTQQRPRSNGAP